MIVTRRGVSGSSKFILVSFIRVLQNQCFSNFDKKIKEIDQVQFVYLMTIHQTPLQAYLNPGFRNIMFSHSPINNVSFSTTLTLKKTTTIFENTTS